MKTCPKCHKEFEDLYTFCIKDGTPLETIVAETDSDIEQVTILRPQTDPPPIPPPIGEETAIMDSSDIAPIGEETAIMSEADFQQVGNLDDNEEVEDFEAKYGKTQDLGQTVIANEGGQTVIPNQELNEENIQNEPKYAAAAQIPVAQEVISGTPQPVQEEKSKSKIGLILAGVGILGLLLLGTAAIGTYLYMQSGSSSTEIASANTEDNSNIDTNDSDSTEDSELDLSNTDADENLENSNSEDNSTSDSNDNKQDKKDKEKDKVKEKDDKKKTPTPTPKSTKTEDNATPTPNATPNFDIGVSTPRATRTPTPRPTRTRNTPTPRPTQIKIPSRIAGGVVNGKATSLPKPVYPSAARSANVKGSVNVAVVINKAGRVISASAVSGHPLLRRAAVTAARRAKFNPTRLSGQAVEVSGTIIYNFQ